MASRDTFNLRGRLSLDGQSFFNGMINATARLVGLEQSVRRVRRNIVREFAGIRTSARAITQGFGIAAAGVTAFGVAATKAFDAADRIAESAQATGLSVQKIQALQLAFKAVDIEAEQIPTTINKLNRAVQLAVEGNKSYVASLGEIGITTDQLIGKNPAEIFEIVADAAAKTEDVFKRTTALSGIFGSKIGSKIAVALGDGAQGFREFESEGRKAGVFLDKFTLEQLGNAGDALGTLQQELGFLALKGFGELMPYINATIKEFQKIRNTRDLTKDIREGVHKTARVFGVFADGLKLISIGFDGLKLSGKSAILLVGSLGKGIDDTITNLLSKLGLLEEKSKEINSYAGQVQRDLTLPAVPATEEKIKLPEVDIDPLAKSAAEAGELIDRIRTRLNEPLPSQNIEEMLTRAEHEYDKTRKSIETKPIQPQVVLADPDAFNRSVLGDKTVEAIKLGVKLDEKELEKTERRINEFAENVSSGFSDSFLAIFKGDSDSILDIWKNMLQQMVAQATAAQLTRALGFGDVEKTQGEKFIQSASDFISTVLPFAGGTPSAPEGTPNIDNLSDAGGLTTDWSVTNNFNINTPNPNSFMSARGRMMSDINRGIRTGL